MCRGTTSTREPSEDDAGVLADSVAAPSWKKVTSASDLSQNTDGLTTDDDALPQTTRDAAAPNALEEKTASGAPRRPATPRAIVINFKRAVAATTLACLVAFRPRLPVWQIASQRATGVRLFVRPRLDLALRVWVRNDNLAPLRIRDAPFVVRWTDGDAFAAGTIQGTRLARPRTPLLVELRVPTRGTIVSHLAAELRRSGGRSLEIDVDSNVTATALGLLTLTVGLSCRHQVTHAFPAPQITAATCRYSLVRLFAPPRSGDSVSAADAAAPAKHHHRAGGLFSIVSSFSSALVDLPGMILASVAPHHSPVVGAWLGRLAARARDLTTVTHVWRWPLDI
mmetsp:Transcript_1716/g.6609  ORF Transcript_1716/g.6609 Transcript_1716/m.6609 type:complete len:339 (+) Transcript_1716:59-1075(+)